MFFLHQKPSMNLCTFQIEVLIKRWGKKISQSSGLIRSRNWIKAGYGYLCQPKTSIFLMIFFSSFHPHLWQGPKGAPTRCMSDDLTLTRQGTRLLQTRKKCGGNMKSAWPADCSICLFSVVIIIVEGEEIFNFFFNYR